MTHNSTVGIGILNYRMTSFYILGGESGPHDPCGEQFVARAASFFIGAVARRSLLFSKYEISASDTSLRHFSIRSIRKRLTCRHASAARVYVDAAPGAVPIPQRALPNRTTGKSAFRGMLHLPRVNHSRHGSLPERGANRAAANQSRTLKSASFLNS